MKRELFVTIFLKPETIFCKKKNKKIKKIRHVSR